MNTEWTEEEKELFDIIRTRSKYYIKKAMNSKNDYEKNKYKRFAKELCREKLKMIEKKEGIRLKRVLIFLDIVEDLKKIKGL